MTYFVFHHEVQWNELLCLRVCLYITPFRRRKSESEWEEREVILGADSRWTRSCYLCFIILRFSVFWGNGNSVELCSATRKNSKYQVEDIKLSLNKRLVIKLTKKSSITAAISQKLVMSLGLKNSAWLNGPFLSLLKNASVTNKMSSTWTTQDHARSAGAVMAFFCVFCNDLNADCISAFIWRFCMHSQRR